MQILLTTAYKLRCSGLLYIWTSVWVLRASDALECNVFQHFGMSSSHTVQQQQKPNQLFNSCLRILFLGLQGRVDVEYHSKVRDPYPHHNREQK